MSDGEDNVNTAENVPVGDMMKMRDELIEVCIHNSKKSVYKIKEMLLKQKLLLMTQVTVGETFKKGHPAEELLIPRVLTSWSL